jgi:hypothetical protein
MSLTRKSLSLVVLSLFAAAASVACTSADVEDSVDEAEGAASAGRSSGSSGATTTTKASAPIEAGKYISNGKMLMIYGRCSGENFLGPAEGALGADGHTMRVEEGNVCRSYKLTPTSRGVVRVSWNKPADAHLGAAVERNCMELEGDYAMTVEGLFRDITPGQYKKGSTALTVDPGCNTPSRLGNQKSVIAPRQIDGKPKAYFQVEEGNVCGGYVLEHKGADVQVTWQKPEGAHLGVEVERSCASADGLYKKGL